MPHKVITPLSWCVCSCRLQQGFPSGSSPTQVSKHLMTFRGKRMKEVALGCSQLRTTFVLLCTVCLNLPATPFTPQGDHVIRSPPSAHLSSGSTAPPERDGKERGKKRKRYKKGKKPQHQMFIICWLGVCIFFFFFHIHKFKLLYWFSFSFCVMPTISCMHTQHTCAVPAHNTSHLLFHYQDLLQIKSIASVQSVPSPPQPHCFNLSVSRLVPLLLREAVS